jgi:hypothetical protein
MRRGKQDRSRTVNVKVLFIAASKRSGSTILGNVLGELDGFFHAGELRTLWGQGLIGGRLCGCGELVRECPFWHRVVERTLGTDDDRLDPAEINRQHERLIRFRYLPRILRDGRTAGPTDPMAEYERVAARLYAAIGEEADARVIVDSSKQPADAAVLRRLPGIEPFFVQLVRDPRAVAYSWQRRKTSPGEGARQEMMRLTTTASTKNWVVANAAAEAVRRKASASRSALVRYETFVTQPQATVDRILRLLHEPERSLPFVDDHHVRLTPGHTAGGNPDRFQTGAVALREDREWLERQQPMDRLVSTALALPLLRRYGYRIRPG